MVTFECHLPPGTLASGQVVHVVGDHPALGCWDISKSVPLRQAAPGAGWLSEPISVPSGVPVQYKYVLFAEGHLQRWEHFFGNRAVVPDRADVHVQDELDRNVSAPPVAPSASFEPLQQQDDDLDEDEVPVDGAILVVSYILPLVISKAPDGSWAIEWNHDSITAKKHHLSERKRVLWVGCPGNGLTSLSEEQQPALTAALQDYGCVPIYLDAELDHAFYFGFCRSFLFPTFHNVIKARRFHEKVWRAYSTANRKFADKVIEVYDSGDLVWVHDYHLLLLPSYILRKLRTARVGLFLHTPFPSSEIFRTIPVRDELLRGMLNADLIGLRGYDRTHHASARRDPDAYQPWARRDPHAYQPWARHDHGLAGSISLSTRATSSRAASGCSASSASSTQAASSPCGTTSGTCTCS